MRKPLHKLFMQRLPGSASGPGLCKGYVAIFMRSCSLGPQFCIPSGIYAKGMQRFTPRTASAKATRVSNMNCATAASRVGEATAWLRWWLVVAAAAAGAGVGGWLLRQRHAQPAVMREKCKSKFERIEGVIRDRGTCQPSGFPIPCRNNARDNQ